MFDDHDCDVCFAGARRQINDGVPLDACLVDLVLVASSFQILPANFVGVRGLHKKKID